MEQFNKEYKISKTIYKYIKGNISDSEKKELEGWLAESSDNKKLFNKITNDKNLSEDFKIFNSVNSAKAKVIMNRKLKKNKIINFSSRVLPYVAASLIIFVFVGKSLFNQKEIKTSVIKIKPGSSKAILTLADGTFIDLKKTKKTFIKNNEELEIKTTNKKIVYSNKSNSNDKIKYNYINIPRGGEYQVLLSDGTKVWINSETRLKYPEKFNSNERRIKLEYGEIFLEVSKDKNRPFIVESKSQKIKVLGTQFNLSSYKEEHYIITTLAEGSVSITNGNKKVKLKPGQQSRLNTKSNEIDVKEVNVDCYTAWKDGRFVLNDLSLDEIFNKISRWYNVKVFYLNKDVKNIILKGEMPKYEDFEKLLNIIKKSANIKIDVKDRTIVIYK